MRVTLVYPSFGTDHHSLYFPFGLAYVASSLLDAGHEVTVVDMEGDRLTVQDAIDRIEASSPEMVAFGGMVTRFRYVKKLTELRDWAQGTIGRTYLFRKPFTRRPSLFRKHLKLRGIKGLWHDARAFLASMLSTG